MQRSQLWLLTFAFVVAGAVPAGAQQDMQAPPAYDNPLPAPSGAVAPRPALPNSAPLVPGNTIEPGDVLSVAVYGDQTLTQTVNVAADGTIAYPLVGRVAVGGKTPEQASAIITQRLKAYVKHPSVSVSISQAGQMNVLVLGNVKVPGKYDIRSGGHLTDALAAAGGLGTTNGDLPVARVTEGDGNVVEVNLQRLLHDGVQTLNAPLQNNSIVYVVGPNTFTVEVIGAVDRPGNVQLDEGDHLSMAIARAGTSPNVYSDLNHVVITRTMSDGKTQHREINMYNALKEGNKQYDPVLVKGDVVYVPQGRRPSSTVFDPLSLLGRLIGL